MRYDKYKKRTAIKKEQNDLHIITTFVVMYFPLNLRVRHFSIPCRYKITLVHIKNQKYIIIKIRTGLQGHYLYFQEYAVFIQIT